MINMQNPVSFYKHAYHMHVQNLILAHLIISHYSVCYVVWNIHVTFCTEYIGFSSSIAWITASSFSIMMWATSYTFIWRNKSTCFLHVLKTHFRLFRIMSAFTVTLFFGSISHCDVKNPNNSKNTQKLPRMKLIDKQVIY